MAKRPPNEMKAELAFQYWINDGIRFRSKYDVANKFDVSPSTIDNWSKRFRWEDRVKEITAKVNENIKRETTERVIAGCEYYIRGVDDIFAEYVRQILSGERKISDEYMVKLLELSTEIQRGRFVDKTIATKADTTLSDFMGKLGEVFIDAGKQG